MMRFSFALLALAATGALLLAPLSAAASPPVLLAATSPNPTSIIATVAADNEDFVVVVQNLSAQYNLSTGGESFYYANVSCPSSACWASSTAGLYFVMAANLTASTEYSLSTYNTAQGPGQLGNNLNITTMTPLPTNNTTPSASMSPAVVDALVGVLIVVPLVIVALVIRQRWKRGEN